MHQKCELNTTPKKSIQTQKIFGDINQVFSKTKKRSFTKIKSEKLLNNTLPVESSKNISRNKNFLSYSNSLNHNLKHSPSLNSMKKNKNVNLNKNKKNDFKNLKKDITPIKIIKNKKLNLTSSKNISNKMNINNKSIIKKRDLSPNINDCIKLNKNRISSFSPLKDINDNNANLYIPHIVISSFDLFKNKILSLMDTASDEIDKVCNYISTIDMNVEQNYFKINMEYANKLKELYIMKEKKIKDINDKYDYALYKLRKTYENKDDIISNEIINNKKMEIEEIEQDFIYKKNLLKNEFQIKSDLIKSKEKLEIDKILKMQLMNTIKKKLIEIIDSK